MATDDSQPVFGADLPIERKREGDDVRLQLCVHLERLLQQVGQWRVGMRLPGLQLRRALVIEDELEELHQQPLRLGGDGSRREDFFAGGWNAGQSGLLGGARRRLEDVEGPHREELDLPVGTGGNEPRQERGARMDQLGCEGQRIGPS